ncbi:chemotaxis protein CheW [Vitiosangium sp. GDMCC 1.1324]|uniref:chemotaxis protein CheW n=1 Tax=Vitiosangium sp. (strain GDMCC 1.1324) TaxID=2138576 RepID=UPI000D35BEFE|nr:chemotaxis protein CheW [Vitiosangium sp. GDMCC 1.1324]PTL80636.1 chemotaxis protein CheW [Vitiosangium sp. GDMCC 1.1324]
MSLPRTRVTLRLDELRDSFDSSFSRPPPPQREPGEALLRLRVGGSSLAVRLGNLSGLHLMPRLVRLPGSPASLLGLAGLRGQLIAVHDLAALLGLQTGEAPRWLLLAGGTRRVGLAAAGFEGQLRATQEQMRPAGDASTHPMLSTSILLPNIPPVPVLDVDSLVRKLLEEASGPLQVR